MRPSFPLMLATMVAASHASHMPSTTSLTTDVGKGPARFRRSDAAFYEPMRGSGRVRPASSPSQAKQRRKKRRGW